MSIGRCRLLGKTSLFALVQVGGGVLPSCQMYVLDEIDFFLSILKVRFCDKLPQREPTVIVHHFSAADEFSPRKGNRICEFTPPE